MFETDLRPIPGIPELLASLDLPVAVVSNGPRAKIELALRVCAIEHFFGERVFSAYELGSWKPEPELYLWAARELGFEPAHCAVIEDGLIGVESGVRAGMPTFFYNPTGEACPFAGVTEFSSMSELPALPG